MVNLPTLCPDTHVSMKKIFKNFFREKKLGDGEGGLQQPPPRPETEGVAAKKINFRTLHFLVFYFCHNNDYVPEILKT